jgi:ubiquinone/menaquinone biosynthesis C-methylase UbiE
MERIPEKELMDDIEQAEAYAKADFSEPHNAYVEHFRKRFPWFTKGEVLDLGCGGADVTIRFAKALPETHITGVDGSESMLVTARRAVEQQGLLNRIVLQKGFLPDAEVLKRRFDAVISNSLLHHLSYPPVMWQTMWLCAKSGAPLFMMDLFRPNSIEEAEALMHRYVGNEPPILQRDFYNSLLSSYTKEEIQEQLKATELDYLKIKTVSDRHIIVWGVIP